ncbi:MAG: gliding motility-associated C-terminal domain-containing protein [Alloprevotella sp.]|nr:gliding motility-associated C-terminal domain-containing protein [Alloprevotella sp.]
MGCMLVGGAGSIAAQTDAPTCYPTMRVTGDEYVDEELTEYDGNAPMAAVFEANAENVGDREALYEWRFTRQGEETPFLVRYDERTDYVFQTSGSYYVELRASFVLDGDTIDFAMDQPFAVSINESRLEVPNAFTPNNDEKNDVFKVKNHQSIVEFRAMVFSRSGKKFYEWTDIEGGWDGRSGGRDCPDGAYYLNIQARGADGRKYNIRKTINLLRGYQESTGTAD